MDTGPSFTGNGTWEGMQSVTGRMKGDSMMLFFCLGVANGHIQTTETVTAWMIITITTGNWNNAGDMPMISGSTWEWSSSNNADTGMIPFSFHQLTGR
jgi:hypothetical protein